MISSTFFSASARKSFFASGISASQTATVVPDRLVDVSQDVIIRDDDCGCHEGIIVKAIMDGNRELESLHERLVGRFPLEPVVHP